MTDDANNEQTKVGFLGRFFGVGEHVGRNIAGLALVILLIGGFALSIIAKFSGDVAAFEIWNVISPTLGVLVGFLFGNSKKS